MCYVCCKEFRGWCKSFTKTETMLSIIEGVLLLILTIFLIFLILHLLACSKEERLLENDPTVATQSSKDDLQTTSTISTYQTVPPHIMCTWELLKTTEAITHYYELDQRNTATEYSTRPVGTSYSTYTVSPVTDDFKNDSFINNVSDWSDGVEAVDEKQFMLALVKIRPPRDITFGCILTVITEYWVLTAASCIEAIEEIDSLDSFVMMKGYGESKLGRSHTVDDVRIHPWYQGINKSYDLAALKSEDSLINKGDSAVILSTMLDYFMITLGEKLTLLGYGRYYSINDYNNRDTIPNHTDSHLILTSSGTRKAISIKFYVFTARAEWRKVTAI
ncbi:uncharacterized protein ACR2FA_006573 [Aphomia sociella]